MAWGGGEGATEKRKRGPEETRRRNDWEKSSHKLTRKLTRGVKFLNRKLVKKNMIEKKNFFESVFLEKNAGTSIVRLGERIATGLGPSQ